MSRGCYLSVTSSLSTPALPVFLFSFFFFNDTATTEIYTLSLHDALPILPDTAPAPSLRRKNRPVTVGRQGDRKSTRLNSSHMSISYAVFCLKKKKKKKATIISNYKKTIANRVNAPKDHQNYSDRSCT